MENELTNEIEFEEEAIEIDDDFIGEPFPW